MDGLRAAFWRERRRKECVMLQWTLFFGGSVADGRSRGSVATKIWNCMHNVDCSLPRLFNLAKQLRSTDRKCAVSAICDCCCVPGHGRNLAQEHAFEIRASRSLGKIMLQFCFRWHLIATVVCTYENDGRKSSFREVLLCPL